MIVAERKPFEEIAEKLQGQGKVLVAGCATCVAECRAGGVKQVEVLASQLRIAFREKGAATEIAECCIERQCEPEMVEEFAELILQHDAVLSMACGIGVQELAGRFPNTEVYPALNTTFMGAHTGNGLWEERCAGCGNCVLDKTAGVCPIARCSKSLLNGPCGGTDDGNCEVSGDIPCAWAEIVKRQRERGELQGLEEIVPAKDWSTARDGGLRTLAREELE